MRRFILLSFLAFPAFAVDEQPPKLEAVPEAPRAAFAGAKRRDTGT